MINIFTFIDTGTAYDACQCDPLLHDGDTLLITNEKVVGIVWTWPVAVTKHLGHLHGISFDPKMVQKDAGWTDAQVLQAIGVARERGYELAEWTREYE